MTRTRVDAFPSKFKRGLVAASLFLFMHLPLAAAQTSAPDPHEVQPERPTVATHAGTVAPGWVEIEAGTEFDRYDDASHGASAPVVFKVGLAPRLQLNVQTPVIHPSGTNKNRIGDFSFGVKWRVTEGAPVLGDFAILPGIKVPSGSTSSGAGTGTTDFSLLFISSHSLGPVAMDLNAGYTRRSGNNTKAPRNATLWTASFGGPFGGMLHGRLGWVSEVYGYPGTSGPAGSAPMVAYLGGPTLQLHKWLVVDAGIIAPIAGPQPRALYAGVVYNVGRLRK